MKVSSIDLKNFKRFTGLRIEGIPETARLVILVGPNGCGKSSVFEGIYRFYRRESTENWHHDNEFFIKDPEKESDDPGN